MAEKRDFNWYAPYGKTENGVTNGDTGIPSVETPYQNPNLQSTIDRQVSSAKNFRDTMGSTSDRMYSQYESQARRNLAQNLKDVDKDYNRRGLLRSGMRMGAQYGQQASTLNDLARARQSINSGLLDTAGKLDTGAYTTAAQTAGTGYNPADLIMSGQQTQLDFQRAQEDADQSIWNSVLKSGGTVAGSFYKPNYGSGTTGQSYSYGRADRGRGGYTPEY